MRLLTSALVAMAVVPAMAATLAPPGTKAYKGWTVTCDNTGACVILGAADGSDLLYLRIARPAGATSSPTVKIVLAAQDALKGADLVFRATAVPADRTVPIGPFPATVAKDDANTASATVAEGAASLAVVDAIRNAATLNVKLLDHEGAFALDGLSAALRDIDARQGRAGTPTALVAKGMTPVGQVPPPAALPTIDSAPAGSVSAIDKPVMSAALTKVASAACDPDVVKEHEGLEAWRIGPHTILTAVPCQGGAYNFTAAFYAEDGSGDAPKPLALPQPPGVPNDGNPPNMLINESFDTKTMVLSSFAKGRGIGDCGTLSEWLWTGSAFALLDASGIDACPGALPEDWPSFYQARRG